MARRPPVNIVIIVICLFATCGLILAVMGLIRHNWAEAIEGLAAATLLIGLTIRTALRERERPRA